MLVCVLAGSYMRRLILLCFHRCIKRTGYSFGGGPRLFLWTFIKGLLSGSSISRTLWRYWAFFLVSGTLTWVYYNSGFGTQYILQFIGHMDYLINKSYMIVRTGKLMYCKKKSVNQQLYRYFPPDVNQGRCRNKVFFAPRASRDWPGRCNNTVWSPCQNVLKACSRQFVCWLRLVSFAEHTGKWKRGSS